MQKSINKNKIMENHSGSHSQSESQKIFRIPINGSKLIRINPSKEDIRKAVIEGGVNSSTNFSDFIEMNFKIKETNVSGQTLLRRFGSGKRSTENMCSFLDWIGIKSKIAEQKELEKYDLTDPKILKYIIVKSKIDVQNKKLKDILYEKIDTKYFKGDFHTLLLRYQKQILNKLKQYDSIIQVKKEENIKNTKSTNAEPNFDYSFWKSKEKSLKSYTIPRLFTFKHILNTLDMSNAYYSTLLEKPKVLREILETGNVDFNNWYVSTKEFMYMRFKSPQLRYNKRNKGTITGQGILVNCFGRHKITKRTIINVLRTAGYEPKTLVDFPKDLNSAKNVLIKILSSVKSNVDYTTIKFKDFKELEFDSPYFRGEGHTLLMKFGGVSSTKMREILSIAGFNNPVPRNWVGRLKNLYSNKEKKKDNDARRF